MAGIGEVDITLNGKPVTLRSSLKAAKLVNAGGGFTEVLRKLAAFDQDYYTIVVAAGLDKKPLDVEADVFLTGLPSLNESLSLFVQHLANGGKPLATPEDRSDIA
jgi:hypothetical protein